jgi:hypothetical protein
MDLSAHLDELLAHLRDAVRSPLRKSVRSKTAGSKFQPLILSFVLLLFLLLVVMVVVILARLKRTGSEFGGMALGGFTFLALRSFTRAPGAVLFVGVEDRLQPRQDFLERGQAAGRALLTARALCADGTLLALRTFRAARTLRARLSGNSRLALRAGFSLRSRFALRACLAR